MGEHLNTYWPPQITATGPNNPTPKAARSSRIDWLCSAKRASVWVTGGIPWRRRPHCREPHRRQCGTGISPDRDGFGAVFGPLDLIDNTTVTVAAIGEIPRPGRMLPDHRPLAAIRLVAPHAGFVPVQQIGQHCAVGNISRRGLDRMDQLAAAVDPEMPPSSRNTTGFLSWSDASRDRAPCRHSWSRTAH